MIGTILGNVDGITFGIDVRTEFVSLDGFLFMIIMITSLRDYSLEPHWDILVVKCMGLMKASNCDYLMVKGLVPYL